MKTHLAANTNLATLPGGGTFTINTRLVGGTPTDHDAIATWYNGTALAGDGQPFASLFLWNPNTTEVLLSTAVDWTTPPPHGLGGSPTVDQQQAAITNKWQQWMAMVGRKGYLDMTDTQSRNGVVQIWGNVGPVNTNSTTSSAIGSETISPLVGKLNGRRIELVFNSTAVGSKTAWNGACVCPKGLNGAAIIGQPITQPDVTDAILNG